MYVQVNKSYIVDRTIWQFKHWSKLPKGSDIDVPSVLYKWEKPIHYTVPGFGKVNTWRRQDSLVLNNLVVQTNASNFAAIDIHTPKGDIALHLNWEHQNDNIAFGRMFNVLHGAAYVFQSPSAHFVHQTSFNNCIINGVDDLSRRGFQQFDNITLQFGVSHNQFEVEYKRKRLNGKCFALIYGTWAILLSDKLEFDTLVSIGILTDGVIHVDKIFYTVNPYITKLLMLG